MCSSSPRSALVALTRAAGALAIIGGYPLASCRDVATTWSAQIRSPDGHWLAAARSERWGGPGTAFDATSVFLKQEGQSEVEVLGFSHSDSTMTLLMKWLTPTRFDVAYAPLAGDSVTLDLQMVRMAGVEITVHRLSAKAP